MHYSEDFLKKIVGVGSLGYSVQKIINVLDVADQDIDQFTKDFFDESSLIRKNYNKGMDIADYAIDQKLFEKAKAGDLKALEEYQKRRDSEQAKMKQHRKPSVKLF